MNTNSWHYNLMCYFKYSMKEYKDYAYGHGFSSWWGDDWRDGSPGANARFTDERGFKAFKAFMTETGAFQPPDFCSYWRNVLLWPFLMSLLWVPAFSMLALILATTTWSQLGFATGVIGGVIVAIIAGLCTIMYLIEKYGEREKKPKEPGFMSKVGEALRNPELCSIMEYDTPKKDDAA